MKENSNIMYPAHEWPMFQAYLLGELKFSEKTCYVSKSKFKILGEYFQSLPFTRAGFNIFILDKKKAGAKLSYLNKFISMAILIDKYLAYRDINYIRQFIDYKGFYTSQIKVDLEILTPQEFKDIAEVTIHKEDHIDKRYSALIYTLGYCGFRITEARLLRKKDVFSTHIIVRDSKNGDPRIVPITRFLFDTLMALPEDPLFGNVCEQVIRREIKKRCDILNIKKRVYPHLFRHSMTSWLSQAGAPPAYICSIMGWKSVATLQTYAHAQIQELANIHQTYHPLWGTDNSWEDSVPDDLKFDKTKKYIKLLFSSLKWDLSFSENSSGCDIKIYKK